VEETKPLDNDRKVRILKGTKKGANIARKGEDVVLVT
jgi:molybdopterin biosynthesis enzyme